MAIVTEHRDGSLRGAFNPSTASPLSIRKVVLARCLQQSRPWLKNATSKHS
ncbi:hypothetical protein [Bradyrhizobium sp.]|uniref:hypothetical protein n=1 Tax=Bradyrhizobium sp. TaxID=376 RepID=UPI0027347BF0|nr:hypothetical protein [Bradyrhizobium sp.]MDP3078741.1 hypothetical protein [Bradyrhizobium sp.]